MHSLEMLFQNLEEQGWAVSDDLLPQGLDHALYQQAREYWLTGRFHDARIGRGLTDQRNAPVRGDSICWLESDAPEPAVQAFLAWTDTLRQQLNRHFFLGLNRAELHFARYEPGRGYKKHIDQHQGQDCRRISLVAYLNPDWQEPDGGQLCLYGPAHNGIETKRILPCAGRVVIFRSEHVPHEVLPSTRNRWSVTGWFRADTYPLGL
ncbi:MAG TPA: 2OG-Fe(II) oxygenase [Candidimonas sp.]|nr:2OG-Fe(II) oxygenase [Candidimonas sp.]